MSKKTRNNWFLCRVCGRRFMVTPTAWDRVIDHIELRHPDDALPTADEFAELDRQESEWKKSPDE